jgi:hypothetical protein
MVFPRSSGIRHARTCPAGEHAMFPSYYISAHNLFPKIYHEVLSVYINMTIIKRSDLLEKLDGATDGPSALTFKKFQRITYEIINKINSKS